MRAFKSIELHQSLSIWGVELNKVVSWYTLYLPFTFASLLQRAFGGNDDGIFFRTRFDGSLFNLKILKSK